MSTILGSLMKEIVFWMAWVIIPLLVEILPAIGGVFILVKKTLVHKRQKGVVQLPPITVIVPVYNSQATLRACIDSIALSSYPRELIDVMLVNNQSQDDGFRVFIESQKAYQELSMRWLNAEQGKSKALNMALFNSKGKYIIHIDSDGYLQKDALYNMVTRFEHNPEMNCMTGVILTDPDMIEDTKSFFWKIVRRCEFMEYAQAFLAGRNFESELDSIYTLSGAFSAFRKSTILKTQLYNSATVCEDTHVTFQVRHLLKQEVHLCEKALFFVDPIEDFQKLYTQRQRWQRGELEVSHMFLGKKLSATKGFFSNFMVRLLMYDHTFAFPRMIWYFALIFLVFMNYSISLVIGSVVIIYLLYVFSSFLFYLVIIGYLKDYQAIRKYYWRKGYLIFLMPLFNFVIFWIRFAGIINSIKDSGKWKTVTAQEEIAIFKAIVQEDMKGVANFIRRLGRKINNE